MPRGDKKMETAIATLIRGMLDSPRKSKLKIPKRFREHAAKCLRGSERHYEFHDPNDGKEELTLVISAR